MVIGIHTDFDLFFGKYSYTVYYDIFNLGVPYFFVASGFFFGRKALKATSEELRDLTKNYCKRLLTKFVVFESIVSVLWLILQYKSGANMIESLLTNLQWWVFFPYGAMWYLLASVVGILMLYKFLKKNLLNMALVIGAVLYCIGLFCNSYYGFISETALAKVIDGYISICCTAHNGVFYGFFFLGLGVKCSDIQRKYPHVYHHNYICFLLFYALYVVETQVLQNAFGDTTPDKGLFLFLPMMIISLFMTTCSINIRMDSNEAKYLRNLSTGMYLVHMPINWCMDRLVNLCNGTGIYRLVNSLNLIYAFKYVSVVMLSLLLCIGIYKWKKEPLFSLLR